MLDFWLFFFSCKLAQDFGEEKNELNFIASLREYLSRSLTPRMQEEGEEEDKNTKLFSIFINLFLLSEAGKKAKTNEAR